MLDVVRIITSKQQIFSVRSSPDPPIFKKIAVRSSPDPAEVGFSPDPVLIRAHLWHTSLAKNVTVFCCGEFPRGTQQSRGLRALIFFSPVSRVGDEMDADFAHFT